MVVVGTGEICGNWWCRQVELLLKGSGISGRSSDGSWFSVVGGKDRQN